MFSWQTFDRSTNMPNSTNSANFDPDCNPTKVFLPYPQLSKVFDHPVNDTTLKTYNVLASQHYTHSELLFFTSQSTTFIVKKQYRHNSQTTSPTASQGQDTFSAKVYDSTNLEFEPVKKD